ncbi:SIS domain-containing protein [Lactiplantibacillus garii]|uniref:SIS domain-containing protein n=2 Tax=Lactiplantibacillus garii TaxID=2306423 RepID=A0A3R8QRR4_9LACO|nr:SIS domain-containing protein [Lactiplantibacillus garii]
MMMNNPTMLSYIRREQSVLGNIVAAYSDQFAKALAGAPERPQRWLILAMASSQNAATTARLYMQKIAGIQVTVLATDQYLTYETADSDVDVIIPISLDGDDPTTLAALKKAHAASQAYTIAMTAKSDSELAGECDATCDLLTGKETIPYITLSFQAIVLSLMLLALRSAADRNLLTDLEANQELDDFSLLIENMNYTVQQANDFYRKFTIDFTNTPEFTAIGASVLTGTLAEMQTKFTEIMRVPSRGYTLAEFTHGGYLGAHEQHCQFYIELTTDPGVMAQLQAVKDYESRLTPHIYTISLTGEEPAVKDAQTLQLTAVEDQYKAPLLAIIPFQVLAWYVAKSKGINLNHPIFTDFQEQVAPK